MRAGLVHDRQQCVSHTGPACSTPLSRLPMLSGTSHLAALPHLRSMDPAYLCCCLCHLWGGFTHSSHIYVLQLVPSGTSGTPTPVPPLGWLLHTYFIHTYPCCSLRHLVAPHVGAGVAIAVGQPRDVRTDGGHGHAAGNAAATCVLGKTLRFPLWTGLPSLAGMGLPFFPPNYYHQDRLPMQLACCSCIDPCQ